MGTGYGSAALPMATYLLEFAPTALGWLGRRLEVTINQPIEEVRHSTEGCVAAGGVGRDLGPGARGLTQIVKICRLDRESFRLCTRRPEPRSNFQQPEPRRPRHRISSKIAANRHETVSVLPNPAQAMACRQVPRMSTTCCWAGESVLDLVEFVYQTQPIFRANSQLMTLLMPSLMQSYSPNRHSIQFMSRLVTTAFPETAIRASERIVREPPDHRHRDHRPHPRRRNRRVRGAAPPPLRIAASTGGGIRGPQRARLPHQPTSGSCPRAIHGQASRPAAGHAQDY